MNNLKSLLLTEGAHGMISQTEGLAISLKTDFNHVLYFFEKHSSGFNIHPIDFEKLVLCPYYFILNVRI